MGVSFPDNYKLFFVLYNITYLLIGAVMTGFGAGSLAEILSFSPFTQSTFIAASALFILVGVLKLITSILGIVAFFIKRKPLFVIYVILAILLMLGTFTAAIVGFLSRPNAYRTLESNLGSAYDRNVSTSELINLQNTLDCCGPRRIFNNSVLPCVSTRPTHTHSGAGCLQPLSDVVLDNLYNVGALGMAFGTFEVTAFLVVIQHTEGSGL